MKDIFDTMADRWPSAIVSRQQLEKFTGGAMKARHQANIDSAGDGPPSIRIGRIVAYPVQAYIGWLRSRAQER